MSISKERFHRLEFATKGDSRGQLIALEEDRQIPFTVRRVYYIFDTQPGVVRGLHAHYDLEQIIVCVKGSCTFKVFDGIHWQTETLNKPSEGLYVGRMIWREMHEFSSDCVLMVLASELFRDADYIRDLDTFKSIARTQREATP